MDAAPAGSRSGVNSQGWRELCQRGNRRHSRSSSRLTSTCDYKQKPLPKTTLRTDRRISRRPRFLSDRSHEPGLRSADPHHQLTQPRVLG